MVPCTVKDINFDNALVDLGASINVMTSFVANWLFLPPLIPTRLSIRLADDSIQFSKGIAKDVLVHVKGFIIPVR